RGATASLAPPPALVPNLARGLLGLARHIRRGRLGLAGHRRSRVRGRLPDRFGALLRRLLELLGRLLAGLAELFGHRAALLRGEVLDLARDPLLRFAGRQQRGEEPAGTEGDQPGRERVPLGATPSR